MVGPVSVSGLINFSPMVVICDPFVSPKAVELAKMMQKFKPHTKKLVFVIPESTNNFNEINGAQIILDKMHADSKGPAKMAKKKKKAKVAAMFEVESAVGGEEEDYVGCSLRRLQPEEGFNEEAGGMASDDEAHNLASEDEVSGDDSDADENGDLVGFIDDSEMEEDSSSEEEGPPLKKKKVVVVEDSSSEEDSSSDEDSSS